MGTEFLCNISPCAYYSKGFFLCFDMLEHAVWLWELDYMHIEPTCLAEVPTASMDKGFKFSTSITTPFSPREK